jgi:hypothetical protein
MLDLVDVFDKVDEYTAEARGIAFDTCHKVYVLMDEEQVEIMRSYGYGNENDPDSLITWKEMTAKMMSEKVVEWYKNSCGLRFIQAISTGKNDEPVFVDIIGQFDDIYDEDEDDD